MMEGKAHPMIIDFHAHCFPQRIRSSAMASLADRTGGFVHFSDGSIEDLKASLKRADVDGAVILNIATNPAKVPPVNDFAASINDPANHIYSFGSVHPDDPNAFEELERIKGMGLKGVKFQPAFQSFYANEKRLFDLYRHINKLGLITVFHCGEDLGFAECYVSPEQLAEAMPCFKDVPVIACHMGGYMLWREVEKHLQKTGVYLDTAFCYSRLPLPIGRTIARSFGPDRILFGTDTPWSDISLELKYARGLSFTDSGLEKVLGGNALKLLQ